MSIKYVCRHCRTTMGELEAGSFNEFELGFHFLTPEERRDIIAYTRDGHITVNVVCDYCKEALETHPELSLQMNPLQ